MKNLALLAAIAAFVVTSGCKKTGEGEYRVETPSVETGTVTDTINVPDVDVDAEKQEVKLPKVDVETPDERGHEGQ